MWGYYLLASEVALRSYFLLIVRLILIWQNLPETWMALQCCSLTHKMTCGLIMQAYWLLEIWFERFKWRSTEWMQLLAVHPLICGLCGVFFFFYSITGQTFRKTICFLLQTFVSNTIYTPFSIISNEIFPTDDSEHEWIVRTCRKSWDEVVGVDPEKSVGTRTEETSSINWNVSLKLDFFKAFYLQV